ncbi:hypothetical protein DY000_02020336 [Brassica cretica]|uniref:Uncharacterized protein n=1 Tax=Brassica cretica TaxID=69181 RepID=A0ABQ7E840_BRACR|nr:hypothetical protein DY000_02020336 [Brassica cretica]
MGAIEPDHQENLELDGTRAGISWNGRVLRHELERTRAEARAGTGCVCFLSGLRAGCDASGKLRSSRIRNTLGLELIGC